MDQSKKDEHSSIFGIFKIKVFYKYLNFWPFYLTLLIILLALAIFYTRYSSKIYKTSSTIEIIDKSMDSEMVLPTAMTIFNRSTINLENETQVISSYRIVEETVNDLSSNISYYSIGNIKKSKITTLNG